MLIAMEKDLATCDNNHTRGSDRVGWDIQTRTYEINSYGHPNLKADFLIENRIIVLIAVPLKI